MSPLNISTSDNAQNFMDGQNYDLDIQQLYSSFIQQIDQVRSHVSVINNTSAQSITTIHNNFILIDPQPQESRAHAFYRLIGLPVVASDGSQFYNPGYDIEAFSNTPNSTDQQIHKNAIGIAAAGLYPLMDARERYVQDIRQVFAVQDISSAVVALSSQVPRHFNFFGSQAADPFAQNTSDQTYSVASRNLANTANFTDYQDASGNSISSSDMRGKFAFQRSHFLKPFMVDPRIDLTVSPDTGLVCVPFTIDKSKTKLRDDAYLYRPLIENICRSRLTLPPSQDDLTQTFQQAQTYLKNQNVSGLVDPNLLAKIYANTNTTIAQDVLLKYFNFMRSMIDRLAESMEYLASLSNGSGFGSSTNSFQWLPIPNTNGPEFGSTTASINPNDPLNTPGDKALLQLQYQVQLDQLYQKTAGVSASSDLGNFAFDFSAPNLTPDENTVSGFGNKHQDALTAIQDKRAHITDQANNSLQTIEIIMGEFSGLGLCDIIAIYTALWSIDTKALVGLLDDKAFNRLTTNPIFTDPAVAARKAGTGKSITQSLTDLETQIKQIFSIMDRFLADRLVLGRVST
jgi:hypothetical protein